MYRSICGRPAQSGARQLRALIPFLLICLIPSCAQKPAKDQTERQTETVPAHLSVVSTLNLLLAIQDAPEDTISYQKKYDIDPARVPSLILAIRPRWDQLVKQTGEDMESWTEDHMKDVLECRRNCDCHFFHEVLEQRPGLKSRLSSEDLRWLDKIVSLRDQRDRRYCLRQGPSPDPALIKRLKIEQKDFEADSAF